MALLKERDRAITTVSSTIDKITAQSLDRAGQEAGRQRQPRRAEPGRAQQAGIPAAPEPCRTVQVEARKEASVFASQGPS